MGFEDIIEKKYNNIHYCLTECIKDNYIGDPEKDIQLDVAQALFNDFGIKGGLGPYVNWTTKYYGSTYETCKLDFDNLKKQKGKDKLTIDYIVKLARPFDTQDKLSEIITDEDEYNELKAVFELSHFQSADVFYQIYNNSLRQFNKSSFSTMYESMSYGKDSISFINTWYKDPNKRFYQAVDFLPPPLLVPDDVFNTWDIAVINDDNNMDIDNKDINTDIIHEFLRKLTYGAENGYEYLLSYVAHLLKFPANKPEVGIFFTSEQGSGKDTFYKLLTLLIGDKFVSIDAEPEDVFGKYNLDTRLNKLVLILQEADNLRAYSGKIKDLITCKSSKIANKGIKQIVVKDYSRLFVFSNIDNILKIEPGDRRWVIFLCYNFFIDKDPNFFNELHSALDNPEVIAKFKQELMNHNVASDYNFQLNRPMTDKYADLKASNTPAIIKWAYTYCNQVDFVDEPVREIKFKSGDLCNSYNEWCKGNFENSKEINCQSFGMLLKKYFYINNIWRGFVKNHERNGSMFLLDKPVLNEIITEKYGYREII